ncbi:MAG: DUF748 domain-containing protein [Nitrospirae bacterium]|nr:DUF748 domain-containing protein [Nitrospirota bacterium]
METIKTVDIFKSNKKIFIWILAAFVLFTVAGFFIVPPVLKFFLIKKLSEGLNRKVTIGKIQFNPYALSLKITGFKVLERTSADTFASFDELYINIQAVSIVKRGIVIREARLKAPYVRIQYNEDRSYNLSDLLVNNPTGPDVKKDPFRFSINNIRIIDGSLDFSDNPKKKLHTVRDILIKIPFISNLPYYVDTFVEPAFEARFNDKPVTLSGTSKPFADSLHTRVEISLKDFDIPYYLAYLPFDLNFSLPSAKMDAALEISFTQDKNIKQTIGVNGPITFKEVSTEGRDGSPLINLPLLNIVIATPDVMSSEFHFAKVLLDSPEIYAVRFKNGTLNLHSFIPDAKGNTSVEKTAYRDNPVQISIDDIQIKEGMILFEDRLPENKFSARLNHINIHSTGFSTEKDHSTLIDASLQTESRESLKLTSKVILDPFSSEGKADVSGIILSKYSPYYSRQILFDIREGSLDLSTGYSFKKQGPAPQIHLSDMTARLKSLKLRTGDEKDDFLQVPSLSIEGAGVEIPDNKITIGKFTTSNGMIKAKRRQDGNINLFRLIPDTPVRGTAVKTEPSHEKGNKWDIIMKDLLAENYTVMFEDLAVSQPVSLTADKIRLKGRNISTIGNSKGRLSLALNFQGKGSLNAGGTVGIHPLTADFKVNLKDISINPLQAYFTDRVRILVTDGIVLADGDLLLKETDKNNIVAGYKGSASVVRFASVDKENAEDFLKWNSLYVGGMDIISNPVSVDIDEISLSEFYSRLIVNPDGILNVQKIFAVMEATDEKPPGQRDAGKPAVPQEDKSSKVVKIGRITLQGGTINFTDNYIKPSYSADLLDIGGSVSGLSSDKDQYADVELRGTLNNYAPLEIRGKINPLIKDLFVDLKADFKNIDLSPVTPYSGRHLGYTVEKGKLTLSMKYLIADNKLDADNKIFLDQFTLGEKVDSPVAAKLPVKFAIALLKDRSGVIDLDLPVTGKLDDPDFKIGRIIIKVLLNIIVKATTSPFALIGSLAGGGEELSFLEFDYGRTAVSDDGIKKLDTLTKALFDRPSLNLEIAGYTDSEKDRAQLKQNRFEQKIKAQKLKEVIKKGGQAVTVNDIKIEDEEYEKYLKMAYIEENFPKPRNFIGMLRNLPADEMEKLMLTNIKITDDDLRRLAAQRASQVRDHILKTGQVEPERIFLIEPRTLQPEKKENQKASRVEFNLN